MRAKLQRCRVEAVMTVSEPPGFEPKFHRFRYNATGLRGTRMRLLEERPTSDAGQLQEALIGLTDVVCIDDTPDLTYDLRVHPVGQPNLIAFVGFTQLALYNDQQSCP
jgi:hypothetical protein